MRRRFRLNSAAILYIATAVLIAAAAMNSQNNLLFWLLAVMVGGFLIALVYSALMLRAVTVRRMDPRHGTVGDALLIRYAITNRSRFLPLFNLEISDLPVESPNPRSAASSSSTAQGSGVPWQRLMPPAPAWVLHVGPGETVHGEALAWPHARGAAYFAQVRITSTFPFGIFQRTLTIDQPQHTLIYPRLYELQPRVLDRISPSGFAGVRMSQQAGLGDEYFGMREYRPGEPLKHVSWKRSAAREQLILVEKTQPNPPRLRIVLDLTRPTASLQSAATERRDKRAQEEDAIALAASLVRAADVGGFEVALTVLGLPIADIPLRRGQWHLHKIMAALAAINLDQDRAVTTRVPDTERAGLVIIAPDRVRPLDAAPGAWYLTAAQLPLLAIRPLGWSPAPETPEATPEVSAADAPLAPATVEAAA